MLAQRQAHVALAFGLVRQRTMPEQGEIHLPQGRKRRLRHALMGSKIGRIHAVNGHLRGTPRPQIVPHRLQPIAIAPDQKEGRTLGGPQARARNDDCRGRADQQDLLHPSTRLQKRDINPGSRSASSFSQPG